MVSECHVMTVLRETHTRSESQEWNPPPGEPGGRGRLRRGPDCVLCTLSGADPTNRMFPHMFLHFLFISKEGKTPMVAAGGWGGWCFIVGEQRSR